MNDENPNQGHEDTELSAWRGEWQSLGGREDFAEALLARAAKDGRRMRRAAATEVLAVMFSTSLSIWLMVRSHGAIEVVSMTGLVLVFNGAWLTYFFAMRADLFRASGQGVEAFIALTRRRMATERRWIRVAERSTLALGAASVPWGVWFFLAHESVYLAEPWRAVVGFGGVVVILAGVLLWTRHKARKLAAEEKAFERNVADAQLA